MSILRSVSALLAAPALASVAAAQDPAAAAAAIPAAPVVSAIPAVSSALTPASSLIAPIPAAPSPLGVAPYPPRPGGTTLWSFLGLSYEQREYRQRQMARTPLGAVREAIQTPLSKITGGLIPPFPPPNPSLAELQAPGPVGAAAKAKLDRLTAKDRIKAIRYLGTVDCHYWPEAEDALVEALRVDRNEWVRLEAAKTLGRCCCCTKKTITALGLAASCSDADGNPVEKSPRVVAAAQASLSKCITSLCGGQCGDATMLTAPVTPVVPETGGEKPKTPVGEGTNQAAWSKPAPGEEKSSGGLAPSEIAKPSSKVYYERLDKKSWQEIITGARQMLLNAPTVPVEFAVDSPSAELDFSDARMRSDHPSNLMDLLIGGMRPSTPSITPAMAFTPAPRMPLQAPTAKAVTPTVVEPNRHSVPAPATIKLSGTPAPAPTPVPAPAPIPQITPTPVTTVVKPVSSQTPVVSGMSAQATKVLGMLAKPSDMTMVEKEIELLTMSDMHSHPAVIPAVLQAASTMTNAPVRSACVRALVRGKANTPAVMTGLEKLVNDRSADVRIEAAAGLLELKGMKK